MVERHTRNVQVVGSNPIIGSAKENKHVRTQVSSRILRYKGSEWLLDILWRFDNITYFRLATCLINHLPLSNGKHLLERNPIT